MTDPVTMALAALATSVGALNLVLSLPRHPELDAERWFKVLLANILLGELDPAEDANTLETVAVLARRVPFHPHARHPERIVEPVHDLSPDEQALVHRLAGAAGLPERWRHLYESDEIGLAARLEDPTELGVAYDPRHWTTLTTWRDVQALGNGDPRLLTVLAQQSRCVWVLVSSTPRGPDVLSALEEFVPEPVVVPAGSEEILEALFARGLHEVPDAKLVFVSDGDGVQPVLRTLHSQKGLRDVTAMVVAVDPVFDSPWMAEHFSHNAMDTERDHQTPYAAVQWLDQDQHHPIGALGRELQVARFPDVPSQPMTRDMVLPLDLGVMPLDSDPAFVAKGLAAFVGLWVLATGA